MSGFARRIKTIYNTVLPCSHMLAASLFEKLSGMTEEGHVYTRLV